MIKLLVYVLSIFMHVVHAESSHLRVSAVNDNTSDENKSTQIRLFVHGLEGSPSFKDIDITSATVRTSYNHVHQGAPPRLESLTIHSSAPLPAKGWPSSTDSHTSQTGQLLLGSIQWSELSYATYLPNHDDPAHLRETVEQSFCDGLRASGSANLANVHTCSIDLLVTSPQISGWNTTDGGIMEGQVLLQGGTLSASVSDRMAFDEVLMNVFNRVYGPATGLNLVLTETVATVDLVRVDSLPSSMLSLQKDSSPLPSRQNSDDDETIELVVLRLWIEDFTHQPDCAWCPPPGDAQFVSDEIWVKLHAALETTLCSALARSDRDAFARVHECRFFLVDDSWHTNEP